MNLFTVKLVIVAIIILMGSVIWDLKKVGEKGYNSRQTLTAYAFLAPTLLLTVVFVIQPIVLSLWYGFTDYYLLEPNNINLIGLENIKNLVADFNAKGDLYNALKNTAQFVVLVVPLQVSVALGLALLVNKPRKWNTFYRVAYFSPVVMSLTVISLLWLNMLRPDDLGLMNSLLSKVGIPTQTFLSNPKQAMNIIVLISAWQGAGFQMLIFLAGLKNIPDELYEAAKIDGANAGNRFRYITLPGLKPTSVFILITTFIGASKLIIQPMVMTGYTSYTVTLSYLIYMEGYVFKMVGYASAVALLATIIIGSITLVQRHLLSEED